MADGDRLDDASQSEQLDGATPALTIMDELWIGEEDDPTPIPPYHCDKCHTLITGWTYATVVKSCRADNCAIFCCARCGYEYGSAGPVGCPCQSRDPKIRRLREMYRARKR